MRRKEKGRDLSLYVITGGTELFINDNNIVILLLLIIIK